MKDMTETHTTERTYYYDLGEHGIEPDHESMAAFLLDEGVVYLSAMWDAENNEGAYLCININDYFHPAADSEDLPWKDIPKLFDMYRKDSYDGVAQYVADKRGIPNKHWKETYKKLDPLEENSYNKDMKKFTQITFNPKGDSYNLFFLDGKLLFQGDYYHDKVEHLFEGITIYLSFMKEEYSRERWFAETIDDSVEYWEYDFEPDNDEKLEKYLKRIERVFNLEKKR